MDMNSYPQSKIPFTSLFILICVVVSSFFACGQGSPETGRPVAVRGIIDLRGWNFERDGSVRLDGEWEFYWDRLLGPSDFKELSNQKKCGFIPVPSLWKNHRANGVTLTGKGHATYRLKILSGPDTRVKTLSFQRILSAYTLWLNGVLAYTKGTADRPIKTREDYIFIHNKRLSSFTLNEGVNEIILHVFNNEYESGGIDWPLYLDDGEITAQREFLKHTINMIVVGLLLFGAIYNVLSYFYRKGDLSPLYIGFSSLVFAINTYNIESPIISGSFSFIENPFLINYTTVVLGMTLGVMIIKSLFPDDFSAYIARFSQFLCAGFIISLFFVEFRTAEQIMKIYFIFIVFFILYIEYIFIKTIKNGRDDAVLFFIGFLPLVIGCINNILYAMWIINTGNAIHYAMVIFCFTTTTVISRRFARALRTVEKLSRDLEAKNISLEKLDRLKDQFLANTSHELRTPLHGMIGLSESMIDGAAGVLPPKALDNLSLISSCGHRLANMVNDLLDMAKIQVEGLNLNLRPVDLYSLSEMIVRLSLPLVGGKPLEIINTISPDIP
ncbi:MAG: hypothetical protein E4G96_04840, partial [Chrysiogenales bacterium]